MYPNVDQLQREHLWSPGSLRNFGWSAGHLWWLCGLAGFTLVARGSPVLSCHRSFLFASPRAWAWGSICWCDSPLQFPLSELEASNSFRFWHPAYPNIPHTEAAQRYALKRPLTLLDHFVARGDRRVLVRLGLHGFWGQRRFSESLPFEGMNMMKAADCRLKHGLKMSATLFLKGYIFEFIFCMQLYDYMRIQFLAVFCRSYWDHISDESNI